MHRTRREYLRPLDHPGPETILLGGTTRVKRGETAKIHTTDDQHRQLVGDDQHPGEGWQEVLPVEPIDPGPDRERLAAEARAKAQEAPEPDLAALTAVLPSPIVLLDGTMGDATKLREDAVGYDRADGEGDLRWLPFAAVRIVGAALVEVRAGTLEEMAGDPGEGIQLAGGTQADGSPAEPVITSRRKKGEVTNG